jgi:hypothetical protein
VQRLDTGDGYSGADSVSIGPIRATHRHRTFGGSSYFYLDDEEVRQFFYHPEETGELRLAYAVLKQALEDFCEYAKSKQQKKFRQVASWIYSNDTSWPFSFVSLCHILGINETVLRDRIDKWRMYSACVENK